MYMHSLFILDVVSKNILNFKILQNLEIRKQFRGYVSLEIYLYSSSTSSIGLFSVILITVPGPPSNVSGYILYTEFL